MRMLSQTQKRAAWAPRCHPAGLRRYALGRANVLIRPELFAGLVLLSRALQRHDRGARAHDTWSYACRPIAGTTSWSMHSYGIALDVRATAYPLGVRVTDAALLAAVAEIEAITTPDGWRVWEWGGRWRRPDGMHFEAACPPASAALLRF